MKSIIIIGASSGIGRSTARIFAQKGWRVIATARRTDKLEELRNEAPDRITTASIDVTQNDADTRLLDLIKKNGGVDVVMNVAGIGKQNNGMDTSIETATSETNSTGFMRIVSAAFRYFADKGGGHIAVISSIAGTKGLGSAPAYSATKRMQNTYIDALDQLARMRKLNIKFTDIRPGFVRTALLDDNHDYPLQMDVDKVAAEAVRAIEKQKRVCVIDWRYRIVTALWSLAPRWLWVRLPVQTKD
ncbi:MAG: SDR family NAD(P)-dependent oxidoreductase [Paludibacteraceae bacterium]|nr:SDR family NAD(P)-dependent oxidoreductase [Paludibacteraceae bacterium]MBQ7747992.1 SDR family NAD(P)-dependent oxidoreductase [Paludibacteraceae bacterium]